MPYTPSLRSPACWSVAVNSTLYIQGQAVKIADVSRDSGCAMCWRAAVAQSDNRCASMPLVDATSAQPVWAEQNMDARIRRVCPAGGDWATTSLPCQVKSPGEQKRAVCAHDQNLEEDEAFTRGAEYFFRFTRRQSSSLPTFHARHCVDEQYAAAYAMLPDLSGGLTFSWNPEPQTWSRRLPRRTRGRLDGTLAARHLH